MSHEPERIPPNPKLLIHALRSIGYSIEEAVADIIDNSISAKAKHVLVRLMRSDERLEQVLIADDGSGMSESRLTEAMRFGADTEKTLESLSKFGMGLKLASLSQGTELIVVTRCAGAVSGRRWTVESISDDWRCDVVSKAEANRILKGPWDPVDLSKHGTVVLWSGLDKIKIRKGGVDATIKSILDKLNFHLGLHFHRFIEDGRIQLWLDGQVLGAEHNDIRQQVDALNPFQYDMPGDSEYPRAFTLDLQDIGELVLEAHVCPPNTTSKNYKLDGAAGRQGLYFYRNDRLIQSGGWNDLREDAEPHLSLARVAIDLPPEFDSFFSLDVQKSSIKAPPVFNSALKAAADGRGAGFSAYLKAAQTAYRKHESKNPDNFPIVPGTGLPSVLRQSVRETLAPNERRVREVTFEWSDIESGEFFEIDRNSFVIHLNRAYRSRLLDGRRASPADVPVIKLLLFLLLREDLDSGRVSRKQKEWLDACNRALGQAMKVLRSEE